MNSVLKEDTISQQLVEVLDFIQARTMQTVQKWHYHTEDRTFSRDNLLAYLALRQLDIHDLQMQLADMGLSSLGRSEHNVLESITAVLQHLPTSHHIPQPSQNVSPLSIIQSRKERIYGRHSETKQTSIMVTIDAKSLEDDSLIENLLLRGMNIARINTAHDRTDDWLQIINRIRTTEQLLISKGLYSPNRHCRIYMDLAGPKIRTGAFVMKRSMIKFSPKNIGYLDSNVTNSFIKKERELDKACVLAVPYELVQRVTTGDKLMIVDERGKTREILVTDIENTRLKVQIDRKAFIIENAYIYVDEEKYQIGPTQAVQVPCKLQKRDVLRLYRDSTIIGQPASESHPASISCTLPEALTQVIEGDRVFFDDGKISGISTHIAEDYIDITITAPHIKPAKLKSGKGINLPDTAINISSLSDEDITHLEFAVKHADIVGLSFIHSAADLENLQTHLTLLGGTHLAVVAKIETKDAIRNLASILLKGLEFESFGVMIARGDLAVEVGFENLSHVQEDILCMCEAAHIPVILATQILERLAKEGTPARAEITDAAMGIRAECVMLNKGPHIVEAVEVLSTLLKNAALSHVKKRQVFTHFTKQCGIFIDEDNN
ncbi:hypothetical protein EJF36_02060 [Bacillus sp. HMF5848]|uniref:pyruvate kinase n=1 Tax=Bacillus sp. HMF5848 TaxID=2495421 RepID=UPI000F782840|nr:pyruvate kinase [Bacillus sp. HMF5848]RSK25774.1 hypothetical protein EJF36_02060 [Bacillus sp. HMF5848]